MRALVLLLLLAFMSPAAFAGKGSGPDDCTSLGDRCDQGEAYASLIAWIGRDGPAKCAASGRPGGSGHRIVLTAGSNGSLTGSWGGDALCGDNAYVSMGFKYWGAACPLGTKWNDAEKTCKQTCDSKPPGVVPAEHMGGTIQCVNGCARKLYPIGDGSSSYKYTGEECENKPEDCSKYNTSGQNYVWNQYFGHCQPVKQECPEGQVPQNGQCVAKPDCPAGMFLDGEGICKPKEEECPAGNIKSPEGKCLPGDGQCAVGEARGADGTCKPDSDGDGTPDEEDDDPGNDPDGKGKFSGGDDCKTPPSCSGDAIMCGQARIQWRIECNTRKNRNVSGGTCDRPPQCTGEKCDAIEVAQLQLQWRATCALEKAKPGTGTGDTGVLTFLQQVRTEDTNAANAQANQPDGTEGINEADMWHTFDNSSFNPGMFGGETGGTCSFTTSLELLGHPIELPPEFWMLATMIGWLVVACAYLWVAMQLGG